MKVRNILILVMALLMAVPISAKPKYRKGFLYREGRQLMLNGKPYRCVSFNSFQLCGCGHDYELFTDEQTEALFASLPDNAIVRTWATPAFHHRTDYLVRLAEKYDIKLILSLGDGRSGCGDFDGAPDGDGSGKTQEWYERGFRDKYLPHVIEMTTRYKDSPAIAMWEIINEPGEADWATIRDFLHEVAEVLRRGLLVAHEAELVAHERMVDDDGASAHARERSHRNVPAAVGEFGVYLESKGDKYPYRLHYRSTGLPLVGTLDTLCRGGKIADLIAISGTLDYIIPDIDR